MNNSVFGKTMENIRKHRDIKLVTMYKRRNQLVSESNYHITKWFSEDLLAIEMKKIKVKMNKQIYLELSILKISKTLMYEFWYDYIKPKYQDNTNLCYMDTNLDTLLIILKLKIFTRILQIMLKKRFDPLIRLMKDELGGKIIIKFLALRRKICSYLTDDDINSKKSKGTKTCITDKLIKDYHYVKVLLSNNPMLMSQLRFKNEGHNVYIEEINKIALTSNDDKRLQTFDNITVYPYGTNVRKVSKLELLSKYK